MKKLYFAFIAPLCLCLLVGCKKANSEVVILFTTDVHGAIETNDDPKYLKTITYATVGQMKKDLKEKGKEVLLLDSGDTISGGFYTTYDNGRSMVKLMNMAGYDASTLGNHEFDYNFSYLSDLMKQANFPFLSSNLYHLINNEPSTRYTDLGSKVFSLNNGMKIGVVGVSTPDSITTSTPSHFKDEKGNFIYTFRNKDLYDVVQNEIDGIKKECDYVICLSHLGDESQTNEFTATKLANNTSGIDVILDGHSHKLVVEKKVKDKNGHEVIISQANSKLKNIGKLTINKKDGIKTEMISSSTALKCNEEIKAKEKEIIDELDKQYSREIAKTEITFDRGDTGSQHETNLGDLAAESPYYFYNVTLPEKYKIETACDMCFVNSGGIRTGSVNKGVWSLKTCYLIHSFSNSFALIEIEGKYIKQALEESLHFYPDYYGGFQQVCGIKFDVNSKAEIGKRISNVKVYNRTNNSYDDLIETNKYLVGGSAYVIIEGGDGITAFKNASKVLRVDSDITDNAVLGSYVSNFKKPSEKELPVISNENSPLAIKYPSLGINYTDDGFARRINIKA